MLLFIIFIITAAAMVSASDQGPSQTRPHITGCISSNMETFRCRWNVGTFQNLSMPGDLRLFYINKTPLQTPAKEWTECPHYSTERPNECFFNRSHTQIWIIYSVQLCSRDQVILYDENLFHVEDIVQPDPPFALNWTLLNASMTGSHYDIMLSWKPPESADVEMGWMKLQYEVQHRDVSSDQWEVLDLGKNTHRTIYGLQANINHEVRIRCKMFSGKKFGEFSDSIFVHIPSKVSRFPVVALLIFGALCLVAILMLVIISQQEKLMVILLPPIPGPKIRGIDPELLKKGKLRELTSILGSPPGLRPELYSNDPWVEFIDLDIEEQNDRLTDLDTDCLMRHSLFSNCNPSSVGFRDDDSGRASCCDPDLPSDPEASPFHPLMPNETLNNEMSLCEPTSLVQSPNADMPSSVDPAQEALYTQVSVVRPSGKVLLTPEEQTEVEKIISKDAEKEKVRKEYKVLEANPDPRGYTSEVNARRMSPRLSTGDLSEPCQIGEDLSSFPGPSLYQESENPTSTLHPAPVYTMVEGVDRQNSLLLAPNSAPAPQLIIQKSMSVPGYLTPDLLGSITP
ncbi:growth hormone receptor-like [Antennarius striatus]|uniref:growth hormone receptor-like n=1 Tax=Antennarius striatus TaxID=241820 RepID=UPI0035B0126F